MQVTLRNKKYTFLKGYQDESPYRAAFNDLSIKTFELSFEDWYRAGYWNEKYIPYTLFDEAKAIANVSVNLMDFNVFGEPRRYVQLGTVMTDEAYRHQGLSKFLMEIVLAEWNPQCDFIYLYANPSVLEFYPKFGFELAKEHACFKPVKKNIEARNVEKLNMDLQSSRNMLHDYAKNTAAMGMLSMQENADLVMFYCITILKENVYYLKALDVIAVATFKNKQLHLLDVFSKTKVALEAVVDNLINKEVDEVLLGFTPEDFSPYHMQELRGEDVLFIQQGKAKLFSEHKIMFPLLSHA